MKLKIYYLNCIFNQVTRFCISHQEPQESLQPVKLHWIGAALRLQRIGEVCYTERSLSPPLLVLILRSGRWSPLRRHSHDDVIGLQAEPDRSAVYGVVFPFRRFRIASPAETQRHRFAVIFYHRNFDVIALHRFSTVFQKYILFLIFVKSFGITFNPKYKSYEVSIIHSVRRFIDYRYIPDVRNNICYWACC